AVAEERRDGTLERRVPAAVHDQLGIPADQPRGIDAQRERLTPARGVALDVLPGFAFRPATLHRVFARCESRRAPTAFSSDGRTGYGDGDPRRPRRMP